MTGIYYEMNPTCFDSAELVHGVRVEVLLSSPGAALQMPVS